jgi:hypothetical protein
MQSEQEVLGNSSSYGCHASSYADCLSICRTCKGKCASGFFLDAIVDVTVFCVNIREWLLNNWTASAAPDFGLPSPK